MGQEEEASRFALGVIDDHRRLIAAGKTHRWDIVKWDVTINVALAAASITFRHSSGNAPGLFLWLALGVVILSIALLWEITRRMTAARNDSIVPLRFLSAHGVDVAGIVGSEPPKEYRLNYDKQELRIYVLILFASATPAFLLWLF